MNQMNLVALAACLFVCATAAPAPQFIPGAVFAPIGAGTGAGIGTGNAGPGGVSATGLAISNAANGGTSSSTGHGQASNSPFGQQASGTGQSTSTGGFPGFPFFPGK